MTMFVSNRDGDGMTDEQGHYKFQTSVFSGNVLESGDLAVTENSPLGLSVLVGPGQFKIDTSDDYSYTGWNTANAPVTISTADPANPRITSIVLYLDKGEDTAPSPPNNPGIAKLMAVDGTPGAVPSAPNGTTIQAAVGAGNPYTVLANVTVGAGAANVDNADISDQRVQVAVGDGLIKTASIKDLAVTTAKIADVNVTTGKLADSAVTTAKVADAAVTEAKWRNGIAFSAYRSAARTLAAQTFTNMGAEIEIYDYGSGYTNTSNNSRFTAPVNGIYSFNVNVYSEPGTNTRAIIEIRKNGVAGDTRVFDMTGTDVNRMNGSMEYLLNAGEYAEPWIWTNVSTNIASLNTRFSGHLITRI